MPAASPEFQDMYRESEKTNTIFYILQAFPSHEYLSSSQCCKIDSLLLSGRPVILPYKGGENGLGGELAWIPGIIPLPAGEAVLSSRNGTPPITTGLERLNPR